MHGHFCKDHTDVHHLTRLAYSSVDVQWQLMQACKSVEVSVELVRW